MLTFSHNFPSATWTKRSKAEDVNLRTLRKEVGRIDLLLASPECTNHTHARGSAKRDEASRAKAYQVVRYARALKPRWIIVENVVNMETWTGYPKFEADIRALGYATRLVKLNAADFGVPQSRRRMFLLCDKRSAPPDIARPRRVLRAASRVVDLDGKYSWTPLYQRGRAKPTIARARRAIAAVGKRTPFILVYYGTDKAGGWQSLAAPLRTVTTVDRFAIVKSSGGERLMRMLQVSELAKAMGFDRTIGGRKFRFGHGTRRDKIRLLGNAVCPAVIQHVIRALCIARRN
jgi:DNA (cytosine-5)-methyltransferase 1